jgi:uncharacterized membrane protein
MPDDAILFEAVIVPHRSLGRGGLRNVILLICGLAGLTVIRFLVVRAWPVICFSVVEVGLAVVLLLVNSRRARGSEVVLLSGGALQILRTDPAGRRTECSLESGWLNVSLEDEPGRVPRLFLVSRGVREEIATALGEAEKRDLAAALGEALYGLRHPVFDNPQLRG